MTGRLGRCLRTDEADGGCSPQREGVVSLSLKEQQEPPSQSNRKTFPVSPKSEAGGEQV